jgi:hypothetical protein
MLFSGNGFIEVEKEFGLVDVIFGAEVRDCFEQGVAQHTFSGPVVQGAEHGFGFRVGGHDVKDGLIGGDGCHDVFEMLGLLIFQLG